MKRKLILFFLMTIFMSFSQSLFAQDFEVDGIYYNILSSTEVAVTYYDDGGVYPQYNSNSYQGHVAIPEKVVCHNYTYTVTTIGAYAFYGCTSLHSISLPQTISKIEERSFAECSILQELVLPSSLKECYLDCSGCYKLERMCIPGSVVKGNAHFEHCGLQELIIEDSDFDTGFDVSFGEWNPNPLKLLYIGRNTQFSCCYTISSSIIYIGKKVTKKYSIEGALRANTIVSYSDVACLGISNSSTLQNLFVFVKKEFIPKNSTFYTVFPIAEDADIIVVPNDVSVNDYSRYLALLAKKDKEHINAVFFSGDEDINLSESEMKQGTDPNCLYYLLSSKTKDSPNFINKSSQDAKAIKLSAKDKFFCPVSFFAQEVEVVYTPTVWADGKSGWDVITLPFEPTSIEASVSGSIVPITTGSSGNFWLRQYVGSSDDAVYFASTSDGMMKANTPYLIAFPGDKMGKGSLEGQTITFKAKNVTIPVTTIPSIQKNGYTFVGNYDKTADEGGGWTLNAEGNAFVWSETVGDKPFSAYFKGEAPAAGASALRMSFGQMDNATGLEQNMADLIDHADETVYTLDGRKVNAKDLKPGLYIKNHKKMMVR